MDGAGENLNFCGIYVVHGLLIEGEANVAHQNPRFSSHGRRLCGLAMPRDGLRLVWDRDRATLFVPAEFRRHAPRGALVPWRLGSPFPGHGTPRRQKWK
jgi:hypothetical protein